MSVGNQPTPRNIAADSSNGLSAAKLALLERWRQGARADSARQRIPRRAAEETCPLSFAQQRLWLLDQLEPGNTAYHVPLAFQLRGPLDEEALAGALQDIVRRHEALRTTFSLAAATRQPVQVITPRLEIHLLHVDLRSLSVAQRAEEIHSQLRQDAAMPFDLANGPLLRVSLFRCADDDRVLSFLFHHIIFDSWSVGIFLREMTALYEALANGRPSPLSPLPIQYADFAVWQRDWLTGEVLEKQLSYWKRQLGGNLTTLELPTDHPRPAIQTYNGAQQMILLPKELAASLRSLSQAEGATLFMTLLSAFQTLLHRHTTQEDIIVGSPIANRNCVEMEGLIGFFVNTLVLRTDLSGRPSFRELLRRVREVCWGAYAHQDLPFEKLVEELRPERRLDRNPLFQVLFALQNTPEQPSNLASLKVTPLDGMIGSVHFDLEVHWGELEEGLRCLFVYNTDLFDEATIARMASHFQNLLEGIAANPNECIAVLPLLSEAERRQLLVEWNQTEVECPGNSCIHELFEVQAERTPKAVAVLFEDQQMTYRELNARANQLAHHLRKLGVGPDVLVCLCVERSLEMVIGVLGILKSGGAYVPLDPNYPKERLALMLADTGAPVLVTQQSLMSLLPEHQMRRVFLDENLEQIAQESHKNPAPVASLENLAYVLYTSGSTGKPKGVAMGHGPLSNLILWQARNLTPASGSKTLQFASLNFDVSFQEIFSTLCWGGTLVVVSETLRRDPVGLLRYLTEESVQRLFLPFVALQQLAEAAEGHGLVPGSLRVVVTAGEQLRVSPQLVWLFERLRDCRLCNQYGPTESHVVTAYTLSSSPKQWPALPPIGRPIANAEIYLLNGCLEPVPVGVIGELYIGGRVLARGYQNRADLTAERFIPNPMSKAPGARLYKTGDLARYLPDGNVEFLGRNDDQVKIRGYRVELGEIEMVLSGHPALCQVAVTAHDGAGASKRLVAYVVRRLEAGDQGLGVADPLALVREFPKWLKAKLPDYMIPSAFVVMDRLPVTPSGKVDRKALPAPDENRPELESSYVAPRTPTEEALVRIWCEVLGLKRVGIQDNFFELGGHSLLAVKLQALVEKDLGRRMPLAAFFQAPTVDELAKLLEDPSAPAHGLYMTAPEAARDKPPLFCLHSLSSAQSLGKHLESIWPVYGIESPFAGELRLWHERHEVAISIEELAARHLAIIKGVQPRGPYYLAGFCFGGVLAFEVANQLVLQGESIALLALLDAFYAPGCKPLSFPRLRRCLYHARQTSVQGVAYLSTKLRNRLQVSRRRRSQLEAIRVGNSALDAEMEQLRLPQAAFLRRILAFYHGKPYAGNALLFRTLADPSFAFDRGKNNGWGEVILGGLQLEEFNCAHMDLPLEPHVREVARRLEHHLRQGEAKSSGDWLSRS